MSELPSISKIPENEEFDSWSEFNFTDDEGTTLIEFSSRVPTPPKQGLVPPLLNYNGEEGVYHFSGDQITLQESALGLLITVTLPPNPYAGQTFTLVLPSVRGVENRQEQAFETIAVKTQRAGFIIREEAQQTYSVVNLIGIAKPNVLGKGP